MQRSSYKQHRILLIARLVLIMVTTLIGVIVFLIIKNHAQQQMISNLQVSLGNHVSDANNEIRSSAGKTAAFAGHPFLINQIHILNAHPDDTRALAALQRETHALLANGFSRVALYGKNGRQLASVGSPISQPIQQIRLKLGKRNELLFKNGYYLRTTIAIRSNGTEIGRIATEHPLPLLSRMFSANAHLSKTAELTMCAALPGGGMRCFPSTRSDHALEFPPRPAGSAPRPMGFALRGESGATLTHDYREQNVVAVFMPVSDLGLGMVLKVDRSELYAPIWRQFLYLLPLLLLLLVLALFSLRWLLNPLITELVRSEEETRRANDRLRASEKRMRMVVDSVDEGILSISADGTVELFNPGAERMFGYRSGEVIGRNVSLLMPEPHRGQHDQYLRHYLKTSDARLLCGPREVVAQRQDGTLFPMELRVSQLDLKRQYRFIGIVYDISERKTSEERIAHLAHHDVLTGLPNRRLTQDRIEQAIVRAQRTLSRFAVMFVDLDKFKQVNDSLGHDAGDQLLKEVAQRLSDCLREEDTVGRQGGDEFIILLSEVSADADAISAADKIGEALSAPFQVQGSEMQIDASIGITVYPRDGADFETLMKHSDMAMYRAKKSGERRCQFFTGIEDSAPTTDPLAPR
jgi:diguanylate cyclase (GGDEF)-like protein/PAS domain S-box-containing protein